MGNMSAFPIEFEGKIWKTSEALFQAMRFNDEEIIEEIRECKSPFGAKCIAKRNKQKMVIKPSSEADLKNMEICLKLKFNQHKNIAKELKETGNKYIYEDVKSRGERGNNLFWGAIYDSENKTLKGSNNLGKLLMKIRESM